MKKVTKFIKGKTYELDQVYAFLGVIPNSAYFQHDPADYQLTKNNDSGEGITFLKDITLKIEITIKD